MRRPWVLVVVLIAGFGLTLGLTIGYVDKVDRQAEQRNLQRAREICGLMVVLDDAYRQTPPTSAVGQHLADEIHRYRLRLGC